MKDFNHYIIEPDGKVQWWYDNLFFPRTGTFPYRGRVARIKRLTDRAVWLEWADVS